MNNQLIPDKLFSSSSIINVYETGHFYENYVLDEQYYPYKFDGWKDKNNYGVYDLNNNVIYPKNSALLEYTNNNGNIHKNINFIVDAFKDLKNYQANLAKTNSINQNSIYTKLNVERSSDSLPDLYLAEIKRLYDIFVNTFLTESYKKQIIDITTFMPYVIQYLGVISKLTPFNRTSFIKSRVAPRSISGLIMSFDGVKKDANYKTKANKYIANPEFDHFLATAAKFGFFVDKNYPYEIVADLGSPVMLSYAKKRGYYNLQQIFDNCYFKAYTVDIESLKNVILSFWNTYASTTTSKIINSNKLNTETIYYNELTMETFEKYYNINWQIRLYLYLRILEERIQASQNRFENLYTEAIKINKYSDIENTISYINDKVEEAKTPSDQLPAHLTTPDMLIRMLTDNIDPLPVEGINF